MSTPFVIRQKRAVEACSTCRKAKKRCQLKAGAVKCELCLKRDVECNFGDNPSSTQSQAQNEESIAFVVSTQEQFTAQDHYNINSDATSSNHVGFVDIQSYQPIGQLDAHSNFPVMQPGAASANSYAVGHGAETYFQDNNQYWLMMGEEGTPVAYQNNQSSQG